MINIQMIQKITTTKKLVKKIEKTMKKIMKTMKSKAMKNDIIMKQNI
jgi:hypothetical protein